MRSFSSVAVAAVATCLLFAAAAEAQASACQTKAVTLQSSCSAFQNAVKQNAALIGAPFDIPTLHTLDRFPPL